jgi:cation diffusion facilitator family transporter
LSHSHSTPSGLHADEPAGKPSLRRFLWLSIGAALLTIALKVTAWQITNSVGLLSDALESVVNLAAAVMAIIVVTYAERPPDEEHAFGHSKAEYFSSGIEGTLILIAAAGIAWSAWQRLLDPQPLEQVGIGVIVAVVASAVNLGAAITLRNAGRKHRAIVLEADGEHLLTDVWTSLAVIIGVALVLLTGWLWLDAVLALLVAVNIVWTGVTLMRRSALGLLDTALSSEERSQIEAVLSPYRAQGIEFHALRTRQAGTRRFMSVHVLAPGAWSILRGHALVERIETEMREALPGIVVFTHLEPLGDPAAMADQQLDRA